MRCFTKSSSRRFGRTKRSLIYKTIKVWLVEHDCGDKTRKKNRTSYRGRSSQNDSSSCRGESHIDLVGASIIPAPARGTLSSVATFPPSATCSRRASKGLASTCFLRSLTHIHVADGSSIHHGDRPHSPQPSDSSRSGSKDCTGDKYKTVRFSDKDNRQHQS